MKPDFALSLSFEGISLLHRAAGGWRRVGEVALDTADLRGALAELRQKAMDHCSGPMACKVMLPPDQVRFFSVETGTFEGSARDEIIRGALAAATPYDLDQLIWDLSPDGPVTHVAAVARETLAEAEAFAAEHAFNPVSFVTRPGDSGYLGEPFFGEAAGARQFSDGDAIEADGVAVVVIGEVETAPLTSEAAATSGGATPDVPIADGADADSGGDDNGPDDTKADDTEESEVAATFSSRRQRRRQERQKRRAARQDEDAAPRRLTLSAEDPEAAPEDDASPDHAEPDAQPDHAEPDAEPAPEPQTGGAGIIAPTLDIPETPEPHPPEQPGTDAAAAFGSFLSRRRKPARRVDPPPPERPAAPAAAMPITLPPGQIPQDEADRMTVFGARQAGAVGGKPRHLGLMLTALLLAFLAGVAAWASLFLDDGIAGLLGIGDEPQQIAAPDAPPEATPIRAPTPSVLSTDPVVAALPETPPGPQPAAPDQTETAPAGQSGPPDLTETDIAVLDALQDAGQSPDVPGPEAGPPELEPPETGPEVLAALPPVLPDDPETGFDTEGGLTEQDAALYAATGIWPNAPDAPTEPGVISMDDLFLAAIDRTDHAQDAVALPNLSDLGTDLAFAAPTSPAAPGTLFALDPSGLVTPSPDGTLSPDGVLVFSGLPPVRPRSFPVRFETAPETDALRQRLAELRPRARPSDLLEQAERSQLGGLTRDELAAVRPRLRPASVQDTAASQAAPDLPPTAQAVAASGRPRTRPANFAKLVARAAPSTPTRPEPGSTPAASVTPRIPSSASVARQATLNNAINLRKINLIGVYGSPSDRRALVRLPSGRYKKVKVGDSMDGGRVLAIGDSELRYQKGGRNLTLKIPSG